MTVEFTGEGHFGRQKEDASARQSLSSSLWEELSHLKDELDSFMTAGEAAPEKKEKKIDPPPTETVSDEFKKETKAIYEKLPEGVRKLLESKGGQLAITPYLTHKDGWPTLKGERPRGWPPGTTWDMADGGQSEGKVVVAEYRLGADGKWTKNDRTAFVVLHESGHALDRAMGKGGVIFTESDEFKVAYERDLTGISKEDKALLGYFLQKEGGRSETFAEMFAIMHGSKDRKELMERAFPEVKKLMEKKLKELK